MKYMKRILIILLCLLPSMAWGMNVGIVGGGGATVLSCAGECTTAGETESGAHNAYYGIAQYNNDFGWAGKFTASSTHNICKVTVNISKSGSPTFNVRACIYTDNAGTPNVVSGTCSDYVAASSFGTTSGSATTFSNMCAAVTNGGTYWLFIQSDTSSYSGTNYARLSTANDGTVKVITVWTGSAWGASYTTNNMRYIVYLP